MQTNEGSELVFVIETCHNCKDHQWNTRHNEERYQEFFNRGKFREQLPPDLQGDIWKLKTALI